MKKLLLIAVGALLSLNINLSSAAESLTPEKKADIERLLDMTGAMALSQQMSSLMIGELTKLIRQARPDIPKELLDTLPTIVNSVIKENIETLKQMTIFIYNKHFSHDETKQMIAFYSTDLGKKTIRIMPTLMQESMIAGQQWGKDLMPEVERRLRARFKKEGVEL